MVVWLLAKQEKGEIFRSIARKNRRNFKFRRWKKTYRLLQVSMNIERHLLANLTQAIVNEEKKGRRVKQHSMNKKYIVQMYKRSELLRMCEQNTTMKHF